jgi:hypothetical protein
LILLVPVERIELPTFGLQNRCFRDHHVHWFAGRLCPTASPALFHNLRPANLLCSSKAKMSALSKVEMSVSTPFWEFGGCHFDGHSDDEQARGEAVLLGVDCVIRGLHSLQHDGEVQLYAFDCLALDGDDLRKLPCASSQRL